MHAAKLLKHHFQLDFAHVPRYLAHKHLNRIRIGLSTIITTAIAAAIIIIVDIVDYWYHVHVIVVVWAFFLHVILFAVIYIQRQIDFIDGRVQRRF